MKKLLFFTLLIGSLFTLLIGSLSVLAHNHDQIPMGIVPSVTKSNQLHAIRIPIKKQLQKIVYLAVTEEHLNVSHKGPYSHVVAHLRGTLKKPYLVVYLYNKAFYSVTVLRINLDKSYQIKSIIYPYTAIQHNLNYSYPQCPDENTQFLIASPADGDVKGAVTSVTNSDKIVYEAAVKKYGEQKVHELLGPQDTVDNFKNYLSCQHLKGVFSTASHVAKGQSFQLYDHAFSYTDLPNNSYLQDTIISFNTCYAYKQVNPGFCNSMIEFIHPKSYTGGVTQLMMYGSSETYACFWRQELSTANTTRTVKQVLTSCARENDPMFENSESPLYLIDPRWFDDHMNPHYYPLTITTSIGKSYAVSSKQQYIRLSLNQDEKISSIIVDKNGTYITCPGEQCETTSKAYNKLFNTPGLKAAEFEIGLNKDKNTIEIQQLDAKMDPTAFPTGHTVYGISPSDLCGSG